MKKISAVYQIINTVTGERYVGSSKDVKRRWQNHKCPSTWKERPNNPLYLDMQKYGVDKFRFQILAPVEPDYLTQVEQEFIDLIQPAYNNYSAKGRNTGRVKETKRKAKRKYFQTEKGKEAHRKAIRKYFQTEKGKEAHRKAKRKYYQSEKGRKAQRKHSKKHYDQPCFYNGETLRLGALVARFQRAGIEHPTIEARKYLL